MGGSQSIVISKTIKKNDLGLYVITSHTNNQDTYSKVVPLIEKTNLGLTEKDWENIINEREKVVDYCILNNKFNSVENCASIFSKNLASNKKYIPELDRFRVVKSNVPCKGFLYRPGSMFEDRYVNEAKSLFGEEMIINGYKCKIIYQDYTITNADLNRCCVTSNKSKCNQNLINGYTTSHCNLVMSQECKKHPDSLNCIQWLEQTYERFDNNALEVYAELCEKNFHEKYCDYFCLVARQNNDYRSEFCDKALKKWCQDNPSNKNCSCLITPLAIIPDVEKYLGPKECWLSSCSSQFNNKWLTTDQLNTRKNCQLTSCIIDINSLQLNNNAKIELINECISGNSVSSQQINKVVIGKNIEAIVERTPGILFNPEIGILCLASILLLV